MCRRFIRVSLIACVLTIFAPTAGSADDDQRVTGFVPQALAVTGCHVVTGTGAEAQDATVIVRGDRIEVIAAEADVPVDARVIDAQGMYLYPGFLDAGGTLLLNDDAAIPEEDGRPADFRRDVLAATRPDNRRGLTPEHELSDSLSISDDARTAHQRQGITAVHVITTRAIAPGRPCLIALVDAPHRETVLNSEPFCLFHIAAPSGGRSTGSAYPITLMGAIAHLRQAFLDAQRHREHVRLCAEGQADIPRPPHDPALASLADVLEGSRRAMFLADSCDDIHRALDFAGEHGLSPILVGGRDATQCIDRLKELDVPVVLRLDFGKAPEVKPVEAKEELTAEFQDPVRVQEDALNRWKERAATAARLSEAGVKVAFGSMGLKQIDEWLPQLRVAVENGLPEDAALAAMTSNSAELLGVEERLGTLEVGKLGHMVVMTGPWHDERSKVRYTIIDGRIYESNKDAKPVEPESEPLPQLAGNWRVTIESGDMSTTTATLELTQDGAKLAGNFLSEHGSGKLDSGNIKDASAKFVVSIGAGDRAIRLQFSGDYTAKTEETPETLSGTLSSPFGAPTKWNAERIAEPDNDNPVQISLDEGNEPGDAEAKPDALPTELDSDRRRAPTGSGHMLIKNATVLTGRGETLSATDVLVRDGKIIEIGQDLSGGDDVLVIDGTGRFVMPGMVDTHSHIMIAEGINESSQSIVPEVRVKDVVESDDVAEYRALAGGLTTARILHGSANVIGGQDAVVKLKHGVPASEHIITDGPQGVKFALGENVKRNPNRFPNTRMGVEATLKRAFFEALDYRRGWQEYDRRVAAGEQNLLPPRRDLRLEELADIIEHETLIHCHCYRADEILMLLRTAEELGIRIQSLQHVLEGYKIAPEIVAHGASCSTFADWWAYKVEAYDATPFNTTLLYKAGANIVVKSDNSELMRHMNLEAAKSLRYGNMPADAVLQMVTINPARELGLHEKIGSIEVGKDADFAVFNGNPLSPFSRCELTIIDGEVRFDRSLQPTAMSAAAQERSSTPAELVLAPSDVRERKLDLPQAINGVYAVTGATVHPVDGPDLEQGTVVIADGKIAAIGADVEVPEDAAVIQAHGMHVYPGLIDAGTTLGVAEIGQVSETQDSRESGRFQPDIRAGIAVNVDSELIPVARAGGVTAALIRPGGMTIAGQCSLFQTAGWTSEEMVLDYTSGLSVEWSGDEKVIEELRELLENARLYDRIRSQPEDEQHVIQDPRFEALRPYVRGEKPVFIEAESRKAIAEAILFAEKEKLKIILTSATDAWKLADELQEREIPVIVGPTMRNPVESWDPFDAPYANPARLHEAGVLFCIRSDNASNSRNVAFEAAITVAYGLPEEEALKAITLNAAKVLGVEEQMGSLTPGKTANLIITDGSPLQHSTQIKGVFVAGVPHAPESRQTRFYERYLQRLETSAAE